MNKRKRVFGQKRAQDAIWRVSFYAYIRVYYMNIPSTLMLKITITMKKYWMLCCEKTFRWTKTTTTTAETEAQRMKCRTGSWEIVRTQISDVFSCIFIYIFFIFGFSNMKHGHHRLFRVGNCSGYKKQRFLSKIKDEKKLYF